MQLLKTMKMIKTPGWWPPFGSICILAAVLEIGLQGQPVLHASTTLQFQASSYSLPESLGSVVLNVQQFPASAQTVTVDYATVDGSATDGVKYTAVAGTLIFQPGV